MLCHLAIVAAPYLSTELALEPGHWPSTFLVSGRLVADFFVEIHDAYLHLLVQPRSE